MSVLCAGFLHLCNHPLEIGGVSSILSCVCAEAAGNCAHRPPFRHRLDMRGSHFYFSAFLLDFSPHGGIWQNKNNGAKWGGRQRMFWIVPSILMAFLFPYNYYAFAYPILIQLIIPFRLLSSSALLWQRFIFVVKTEMPRVEFARSFIVVHLRELIVAWFPTIPFQNEITTPIFLCFAINCRHRKFFSSVLYLDQHSCEVSRSLYSVWSRYLHDGWRNETNTNKTNNKQSHSLFGMTRWISIPVERPKWNYSCPP